MIGEYERSGAGAAFAAINRNKNQRRRAAAMKRASSENAGIAHGGLGFDGKTCFACNRLEADRAFRSERPGSSCARPG